MHDEFDTLIDNAVQSYSAAEPSPELATIILRRAQQEQRQRHNPWKLAMTLALPVAAVAVIALMLARPMAMPPAPPAVATALAPAAPAMQAPAALVQATAKSKPAAAHVAGVQTSRSIVRPLPTHYTSQELAMLTLVERYPKAAAAIAQSQSHSMQPLSPQPITVAQVKIAPLHIPALSLEN